MSAEVPLPPNIARQDKGPSIVATISTLTAICTVFVAGRVFVRAKILKRMGLDDYLILFSMVCGYISLGLSITAVRYGNGRHFQTLSVSQKEGAILYTIAGFCPGIMSFAVPKIAVVSLLTKIMNPSKLHRIFLWVMTTGTLILLLGCVGILFGQCTPSKAQWNFDIKGECWSPWVLVNYAIVAGTMSAFVDLYLAVYPAIVLWKLQMNIKKKLGLSIALGLGSVATVVAIYKTTRLPGLASPDFSYNTSELVVWTSVEGNTIIIAACIPTLQPLLELLLGRRAFGDSSSRNRHYVRHSSDQKRSRPSQMELSVVEHKPSSTKISRNDSSTKDPAEVNSQESILGADDVFYEGRLGYIKKTHEVTVSYEESQYGEERGEERKTETWRRV